MRITPSRSDSIREDEELRLPRAPGVLRRFWARHPVVADWIIALLCVLLSLAPVANIENFISSPSVPGLPIIVPGIILFACVTVLWRRRNPLLPFIVAFSVEAAFLFVGVLGTPLILVGSYALAVYRSARAAWAGFGIGMAALTVLATLSTLTGVSTFQTAANTVISALVLGLIGTLIGVNVGGRKRYLAAVIDRSRQLLIERDQQAQLAAAAERARIAREMHDIVSHSLTVVVALSEGAAATSDREQARAASSSAAETARGALTEMRAMLGVLRDDESPIPLAPLTPAPPQETVTIAQRAGYPVTLTVTGDAAVSPAVAHAVGRIVQEGVTNAMRHAPAATAIAVRVAYSSDEVEIEIINDGAAGPVGTSGFGLRGLSERAAHVGGRVQSSPTTGGRWVLHAALPSTPDSPTLRTDSKKASE